MCQLIFVTNNILAFNVFQELWLEIKLNTKLGQMHELTSIQMTPQGKYLYNFASFY